jgi:hypothetical protein
MMIRVYKEKIMILVFILTYTFSKLIYEASFVLGFFLAFMKKS